MGKRSLTSSWEVSIERSVFIGSKAQAKNCFSGDLPTRAIATIRSAVAAIDRRRPTRRIARLMH